MAIDQTTTTNELDFTKQSASSSVTAVNDSIQVSTAKIPNMGWISPAEGILKNSIIEWLISNNYLLEPCGVNKSKGLMFRVWVLFENNSEHTNVGLLQCKKDINLKTIKESKLNSTFIFRGDNKIETIISFGGF